MRKKIAKKSEETSIDDLAVMVQKGFLDMEKKMGDVKKEIKNTKDELKYDISDVKAELNRKVHIFDYKSLEYRVEKLEEKVGITKKK